MEKDWRDFSQPKPTQPNVLKPLHTPLPTHPVKPSRPLGKLCPLCWQKRGNLNFKGWWTPLTCGAPFLTSRVTLSIIPTPHNSSTSSIHVSNPRSCTLPLGFSLVLGGGHLELIQERQVCLSKYKQNPLLTLFFTISWAIVMLLDFHHISLSFLSILHPFFCS